MVLGLPFRGSSQMNVAVSNVWLLQDDGSAAWMPAIDFESLPEGSTLPIGLVSTVDVELLRARFEAVRGAAERGADCNDVTSTNESHHVDYQGGVFVVSHDYFDAAVAHLSTEQLMALLEWRLAIVESAEFLDPSAHFESIAVEMEIVPAFDERTGLFE